MRISDREFYRDLMEVLNRHCIDNETNTPDFILASMIKDFLSIYRDAKQSTDKWHEGGVLHKVQLPLGSEGDK